MTMLNTIPHYAAPGIRRGAAVALARLGRLANRWIAAFIAHRERQANLFALRYLSDRDLKDIGVYRCEIGGRSGGKGAGSPADTAIAAMLTERTPVVCLAPPVLKEKSCPSHG
jgi:uncharacterized protein YjiS (DUF1127 family)